MNGIYIKRGYIPDGSGMGYKGKQLEQYASCYNDDNLLLFMSKNYNHNLLIETNMMEKSFISYIV